MAVIASVFTAMTAVSASKKGHMKALHRVLRSPMRFFETTPTGRIMNRLSSDIDILDTVLPPPFMSYIFGIVVFATTFVVISYSTPVFLVAAIPIIGGMILLQVMYKVLDSIHSFRLVSNRYFMTVSDATH